MAKESQVIFLEKKNPFYAGLDLGSLFISLNEKRTPVFCCCFIRSCVYKREHNCPPLPFPHPLGPTASRKGREQGGPNQRDRPWASCCAHCFPHALRQVSAPAPRPPPQGFVLSNWDSNWSPQREERIWACSDCPLQIRCWGIALNLESLRETLYRSPPTTTAAAPSSLGRQLRIPTLFTIRVSFIFAEAGRIY